MLGDTRLYVDRRLDGDARTRRLEDYTAAFRCLDELLDMPVVRTFLRLDIDLARHRLEFDGYVTVNDQCAADVYVGGDVHLKVLQRDVEPAGDDTNGRI